MSEAGGRKLNRGLASNFPIPGDGLGAVNALQAFDDPALCPMYQAERADQIARIGQPNGQGHAVRLQRSRVHGRVCVGRLILTNGAAMFSHKRSGDAELVP